MKHGAVRDGRRIGDSPNAVVVVCSGFVSGNRLRYRRRVHVFFMKKRRGEPGRSICRRHERRRYRRYRRGPRRGFWVARNGFRGFFIRRVTSRPRVTFRRTSHQRLTRDERLCLGHRWRIGRPRRNLMNRPSVLRGRFRRSSLGLLPFKRLQLLFPRQNLLLLGLLRRHHARDGRRLAEWRPHATDERPN